MNPRDTAEEVAFEAVARAALPFGRADPEMLAAPDMGVLRLHRRLAPALPLAVFGDDWARWITNAARAAACAPDFVVAPLLASASALIGNARWPQATLGWAEPPHLWCGAVGDSGSGKSPGGDCIFRHVLPALEVGMTEGFADRLREWAMKSETYEAAKARWKADVRKASKDGNAPPEPPMDDVPPEPQRPRLRQADVTIERVAAILANGAPKGLLITRDELSGWLLGMNTYNEAGRAFWIEAYGGKPYSVDRQKLAKPIEIQRLAVAAYGTVQPQRLSELMKGADDGLLSRFLWSWPQDSDFELSRISPNSEWAIQALEKLRALEMADAGAPGAALAPRMVPLAEDSLGVLEYFARDMQVKQRLAGGLMNSAFGKARGLALRLSIVLEFLWWAARNGFDAPPVVVSEKAFLAASHLVADYFMPMAERVYGDAACRPTDRNAATLARWIAKERPEEVHVRRLQREVRLPGLADAEAIRAACVALVEAGWLIPPRVGFGADRKVAFAVNRRVFEVLGGVS